MCDLYCGAEAVRSRYVVLMTMVASKTSTHFHPTPLKGILRICEKLAMAPEWNPGTVLDVVRGAIECPSFSMMINVLRLLQDLDKELKVTGVAGGITEEISIVRCKGRFGRPTSGGWGDIMLNFYFKDDTEWTHVCEIQLVHAELYSVRENMGAHRSYNEFRAALELCEKVGADPEEGSDAGILETLVWTPARHRTGSDPPNSASNVEGSLILKLESSHSQLMNSHSQLMGILQAQNERIAALEKQNDELSSRLNRVCEKFQIPGPTLSITTALPAGTFESENDFFLS